MACSTIASSTSRGSTADQSESDPDSDSAGSAPGERAIAGGGGEADSTEADEVDAFEPGAPSEAGATDEMRWRGDEELKLGERSRLLGFRLRLISEKGDVVPER